MCTVSFIPNAQGFYLAMNRDELLTRVAGLPPCVFEKDGYRAIYPREPSGGTWMAVNERGICLTITNWHRVECVPPGSLVSRGEVVKSLALASSLSEVEESLQSLPLSHMRPFRLFAIASHERSLQQFRKGNVNGVVGGQAMTELPNARQQQEMRIAGKPEVQ